MIRELEEILGLKFNDTKYLRKALTHSSYSNEHRCESYEKQEFLGDSVLSLIVSDYLFKNMKKGAEGELSRIRASLVCEESLAEVGNNIGLSRFVMLGKGEEKYGTRDRASLISDVFEAILAAIYLDMGYEKAREFLMRVMGDKIKAAASADSKKDYKSNLQETIQKISHGKTKIQYQVIAESGPEHDKNFEVELLINSNPYSKGIGKTKKEAEQEAAKSFLSEYGNERQKLYEIL